MSWGCLQPPTPLLQEMGGGGGGGRGRTGLPPPPPPPPAFVIYFLAADFRAPLENRPFSWSRLPGCLGLGIEDKGHTSRKNFGLVIPVFCHSREIDATPCQIYYFRET